MSFWAAKVINMDLVAKKHILSGRTLSLLNRLQKRSILRGDTIYCVMGNKNLPFKF